MMDNARNVESRRRIPLFNAAAARRGGGAGGRRVVSARSMDRMDPGSKESRVDFRSTFSVSFFSICVAARRLSLSFCFVSWVQLFVDLGLEIRWTQTCLTSRYIRRLS
jgi:hypothetical protein